MSAETIATNKNAWNVTLAGWLLLWVVIAAVLAAIRPGFPAAVAGCLIWLVAVLLKGGGIRGAQRIQVIAMFSVGSLGLLAVLVMLSHQVWPKVPVLTLVTLIAVLVALSWSVLREGVSGVYGSIQHVQTALPRQGNEVMLFLGAAVLGAGVAALHDSFGVQLSFATFGANQAFVVLLIMVTLAMVGMHPITSVTLVGSLLAPVVDDPNLLALVFLMTWAFGAGISPFSGLQLSLLSRYQIDVMAMLRRNWRYALVLLAADYLTLQIYGWLFR